MADNVCQPLCAADPDCASGVDAGVDRAADDRTFVDRTPIDGQSEARSASYPVCADDDGCPIGEFCYRDELRCHALAAWSACPRMPLSCPAGGAGPGTCLLTLLASTFPLTYGDVCAQACGDAGACPAAPSGTALPTCSASAGACVLDCSGGLTCPTGMTCSAVDSHCTWPEPGQ